MGDSEHFQSHFTCIMENLLHSAVAETTKLFERTVQHMKAELVWIRKQNDKVKDSLCSDQRLISKCKGDESQREIGVQCDVTSTLVEQSCSPHSQQEDANKTQTETGFSDLFPGFLQDGNQQFTLLFIKPEDPDMCDYPTACLLPKLAEAEPKRCLVQPQEAGLLPVNPSPCQGPSDPQSTVLFTHNSIAPTQSVQDPATSASARTPQSQECNPVDSLCASLDPVPDTQKDQSVQEFAPAASARIPQSQELYPVEGLCASLDLMPDAQKDENISASINDVAKLSCQDQPRRLSARKSKSIYRRLMHLEIPQHDAENIQQENETSAKIQRKTGKITDKQPRKNQLLKNEPEGNHRHKNQCEVCDLVLSSASSLKHHWKVHIAEKDSVCYRCGKIFPNERSLKSHQCLEDEKEQDDYKNKQHQKTHQDQPRRLSTRRSKSIYRRLVDLETTQSTAENIQQADDTKEFICHVPTPTQKETSKETRKKSLKQPCRSQSHKNHSLTSQPGNNHSQKNQCEVSEQVINTPSSLEPHCGEKPFVCVRCGKAFLEAKRLRCHLLVHTKDKRNQCLEGDASMKTGADSDVDQQSLESLQKTHQGQPRRLNARKSTSMYRSLVNLEKPQPSAADDIKASTARFAKKSSKTTNMKSSKQPNRTQSDQKQPGEHHCGVCGWIFLRASSLKYHQRVHSEKHFVCDRCGKAFSEKKKFKRHLNLHTKEKRYGCLECGKRFSFLCRLTSHQLTSHTATEKSFHCKLCGKRFASRASLANHMLVHKGKRPHVCTLCGRGFLHLASMKVHMRRHKGEKPHKCQTCGKQFVEIWDLKTHERIHTGEKPYQCKMCGLKFRQSGHLKSHIKRRHRFESHQSNSDVSDV